ncbi:MAG: response regulator transcription factor [Ktedonobacterales bacterium]
MQILLVEDEARLARSYQRNLERAGHRVEVRHDAETAYRTVMTAPPDTYDALIFDILLPGHSGVTLCRALRQADVHTPILLLTALDQTEDKVAGLDAGADDYLTKPFPLEELLARLRALARRPRSFDPVAAATQLRIGDLVVDELRHEATRGAQRIPLTPHEFALLAYLARNADRVLTRQQLSAEVWPEGTEAGSNVLDTYIHHLRDKIEAPAGDRLLRTVRGVGYMLQTPHDQPKGAAE